jgi:hypothetical protein
MDNAHILLIQRVEYFQKRSEYSELEGFESSAVMDEEEKKDKYFN